MRKYGRIDAAVAKGFGSMDLMEYRAQALFEKQGIRCNAGVVVDSLTALEGNKDRLVYPAVIKAQVKTGGRGKAGGVKFADSYEQAVKAAEQILGMDIKGHIVKKLMISKKQEVAREFYLSVMLDRGTKCPVFIFSPEGGMDIETLAKENPEKIFKSVVNPMLGAQAYIANYFASKAGLDKAQTKELAGIVQKLYQLFIANHCLLCEINPLAVDTDGSLIALDGKISVDDSALAKLPELAAAEDGEKTDPLVQEAADFNFLYIPCDPAGDIAVVSNGSGMIMSCIDHIAKHGMTVRASLDLGGGATADRIKEAVRIILADAKIHYLFINIFGGITRCSEVALGIKKAIEEYRITSPIIVRFEGTNKEIALETIKPLENVIYADGLISGVKELCAMKKGGENQ